MKDIISKIIPAQELTILGGAGQAGKTTLLMQMLCQVQRGELVFGKYEAQRNLHIIYIAADRTWRSYAKTAKQVGLDLSEIKVKALVDDMSFDHKFFEHDPFASFRQVLEELLPEDRSIHSTVLADPLIIWLGCNTIQYHMVASRLILLNKMCNEFNMTLFGTHHSNKAGSDIIFNRPSDRMSGSSAITDFTSTQLFLSTPEGCGNSYGYSELYITTHHAAPLTLWFERGDHGLFTIAEHQPQSKKEGVENRILSFISIADKISRASIIEHLEPLDISISKIDRAIKKLKKEGKISHSYQSVGS